jgi:hypothetical protein
VAGADWPARAAAAFAALTTGDDLDAHGIGTALLADIRDLFAQAQTDRMTSAQMAGALAALEDKPWPEFGKSGKPITPNQVARLLGRFGIRSRTIRTSDGTSKGYLRADFEEDFARYLRPTPFSNRNSVTTLENIDYFSLSEPSQPQPLLRLEKAVSANKDAGCYAVTVAEGGSRPNGSPITEPPDDLPVGDADAEPLPVGGRETAVLL